MWKTRAPGARPRRSAAIGVGVEPVFPDSLGRWRDPANVRRVWRELRDELEMTGLVSHQMRKTVATLLDDAQVSTREISDQLGHSNVSMTHDKYLGRRLTDRQPAEVLEGLLGEPSVRKTFRKMSLRDAKRRACRRQNPGDLR
jgi:integrase